MVIPCFPKKQAQQPPEDELNAFDLTWRNYIPSASQLCCCFPKSQAIRLEDEDPLIEPPYYNDHSLYRGEPIHNYDNDTNFSREFDNVLGGQNDPSRFVTRNPFGTASIKKKKKSSSKKKKSSRHQRPVVMETDMEEEETEFVAGYEIDNQSYYNDDAEFLGDDQIANLAYNRHSNQFMDQYGEELYYHQQQQHLQGPVEQEMQAPPRKEFYAARTIPSHLMMQPSLYEQEEASSSRGTTKPQYATEAAQAILSERLDDLTEKLAFIKNNIINIKPEEQPEQQVEEERESDANTLHTIQHREEESISDIDSIASEALDAYENTTQQEVNTNPSSSSSLAHHQARRFSANELHLPSFADTTPFVSDQHPFSYFTDHSTLPQQEQNEQHNNNNEDDDLLNVKNVFNIGRKWLGV